jgi:hypothetical protein
MQPDLLKRNTPKSAWVEAKALTSLASRVAASDDFSEEEIEQISALDRSLFLNDFQISEETQETFRVLCSFSRCELKPSRSITSHRPFVGPVIVFLKRLSWPIIRFHLKEPFESMQLFNSRLVASHAKEVCRLDRLNRQWEVRRPEPGSTEQH